MGRLFVMLCLSLSIAATSEAAPDFSGVYSIVSQEGPMTLSLQQADDRTVKGTLVMHRAGVAFQVSGEVVVDEDDEWSIEGTLAGATGGGEFDFSADDEDDTYYLLIIPNDADGVPRLDLAASYIATPGAASQTEETTGGTSIPPPPAGGARDPRVIGMWSTQVIMNTPNGGMATQLVMEIRPDGVLIDHGSRAIGGISDVNIDTGVSGGGESVSWQTQGTTLYVSAGGSAWVPLAQFEATDTKLLLVYYDGDRTLWHRQ